MNELELTDDEREKISSLAHAQIKEPEGRVGLKYLINRGISKQSIIDWELGYCPPEAPLYRYSNKIVIPYRDVYGEKIALATRKLKNEKPVWWNESFDKGYHLFGLNKAKKEIYKKNLAILVEGYFDVISLHQYGIKIAVGSCSGASQFEQWSLLSRYCDRVVVMFDRDENMSGQKGIKKAFQDFKGNPIRIYPCYLPMKTDPDEFVRKNGKKKMIALVKKAVQKKKDMGGSFY